MSKTTKTRMCIRTAVLLFAVIMLLGINAVRVFADFTPWNVSISEDGILRWDKYTGSYRATLIYIVPDGESFNYQNVAADIMDTTQTTFDIKNYLHSNAKPSGTYKICFEITDGGGTPVIHEEGLTYNYVSDISDLPKPTNVNISNDGILSFDNVLDKDEYYKYNEDNSDNICYHISVHSVNKDGKDEIVSYSDIYARKFKGESTVSIDYSKWALFDSDQSYYFTVKSDFHSIDGYAYVPSAVCKTNEVQGWVEYYGDIGEIIQNNKLGCMFIPNYPGASKYSINVYSDGSIAYSDWLDVTSTDTSNYTTFEIESVLEKKKLPLTGEYEVWITAYGKSYGTSGEQMVLSNAAKCIYTFSDVLMFTQQPQSKVITENDLNKDINITASAQAAVSYSWEVFIKGEKKTWAQAKVQGLELKSTADDKTITVQVTGTNVDYYELICTAKDSAGNTITSDTARVSLLRIDSQTEGTVTANSGEKISLYAGANIGAKYEWCIAKQSDGQQLDWGSSFGVDDSDVHKPVLELTVDSAYYKTCVWCKVTSGGAAITSKPVNIELTSSDMVEIEKGLEDVSVLKGGTATFTVDAKFAERYEWTVNRRDIGYLEMQGLFHAYYPNEYTLVLTDIDVAMDGAVIEVFCYHDMNDDEIMSSSDAILNVSGSIDLGNGDNVIRRTVYYGDDVTIGFDDLNPQEAVTYTVIYTTPSGTKTTWTNGDYENWLILNPKYEPYKTMLQAGNTLEIYAVGIDYNKGGQAFTDTAILTVVYKPGDMDLNGTIDQADAALYLKYLSGTETFSTTQLEIADVNYDGYKDMRDVIAIMKIADKA